MTRSHARELAMQREMLVIRADVERLQLRLGLQAMSDQLNPRGWALRAWDAARHHPASALVAVAAIAAARRAGWRNVLTRGLLVWRAWQATRRWLRMEQMP